MTFFLPTASQDRIKRTDDPAIQAELLRQGWIQDDEPSFDPATQHPPVRENRAWVVHNKTAEELAAESAAAKETAFRALVDAGYTVQPEGFTLRMDDNALTLWNQQLTLLREAEALGAITGESPAFCIDKDGVKQTTTVTRFRQIIVQLGMAFQQAFFECYGS